MSRQCICYNLNNIYKQNEVELEETVKEILTGQIEEQLEVSRKREYYNLATIIAVGQWVSSCQATQTLKN